MSKNDDKHVLRCSFCGKPQNMFNRLIAGNDCYICEECVDMCASIIAANSMEEEIENEEFSFEKAPMPF